MTLVHDIKDTPPRPGGFSPWETIQHVHELAPGIISVSTASHGGLWINCSRLTTMLKEHPELCRPTDCYPRGKRSSGYQWFEEDCEWARVALAFPAAFTPEHQYAARRTLQVTHPEILAAFDKACVDAGKPLVGLRLTGGAS